IFGRGVGADVSRHRRHRGPAGPWPVVGGGPDGPAPGEAVGGWVRPSFRAGSYTRRQMRSPGRPEPAVVVDSRAPAVAHPCSRGATMGFRPLSVLVARPPASTRRVQP